MLSSVPLPNVAARLSASGSGPHQNVYFNPNCMTRASPGMPAASSNQAFRTPDVLPTILAAMGIPQTAPTDGTAFPLGG